MKNIGLTIAYLFLVYSVSHARIAEDILSQRDIKKFSYTLTTGLMEAIVINMQFGQAEVISNSDRAAIRHAEVFQVDLVFSDFPADYDMKSLNMKRIRLVEKLRSDLVRDERIEWRLIRQMRCKNEAEAKTLFHGIVIHYRPEQSEDVMKIDAGYLLGNLPSSDSLKSVKKLQSTLKDTTVIHILNRNKNRWKDMVVVADLTGSMAPYTSQLILWLKLSSLNNKVKSVTFFNDGDMSLSKPIGRTGGIYQKKTTDYDEMRELALKTILAGGGGDSPENDCEALISAQEFNRDAKELILIADNMARIKDNILSKSIKKPVRIILCGTQYGINAQYLNLARDTGGSVHTIEKDILNLMELEEGKFFTLNKMLFKIQNDNIIRVKKS